MGHHQLAAQNSRRTPLARAVEAGAWLLACLVPATFLALLFGLTYYAIPESDDFCLSHLNATSGFVETTRLWYFNTVGRIVPLFLIQIPNAISDAVGLDYFLSYTATLAAFEIGFAAAILLVTLHLWPQAKPLQIAFMAAALLAVTLSGVPSIREMLYWLPGVTCYTLPGAIVAMVLALFVRAAETGERIGQHAVYVVAAGSFVASLCNEFTPAWLIGLILCSLIFRAICRWDLQIGGHALVGAAAVAGFLIMVLAPGNGVRMTQFSLAGDISRSLTEAYVYTDEYVGRFYSQWPIRAWLVVVLIFSAMQSATTKPSAAKRLLLAILIPIFCVACAYLAHFTAQYSTGNWLATRAQNQVAMLLVVGSTASAVVFARAVSSVVPTSLPIGLRELCSPITAILLAAILIWPFYDSMTMKLVRSEGGSLRVFWLESMARHAQLSLSAEANVTVARHNAFPSVLSGEDLGDDPAKLPNDCIARFYRKKTVMLAVPKETFSDVLPVLATLIREIREERGDSQGRSSPPLLRRGQNLSPLLGRLTLARSAGTSTLDFYSLPKNICGELLFEASKLPGVLRVAGSANSRDERVTPINPDAAQQSCEADGTFARVILSTPP